MPVSPIVTPPGQGDVLQFSPTELLIWKATLDRTQTFDQLTLTAQPGHAGAPEHVHSGVEECFYVLDGAFRFKVADSGECQARHHRRRSPAPRRAAHERDAGNRPVAWRLARHWRGSG